MRVFHLAGLALLGFVRCSIAEEVQSDASPSPFSGANYQWSPKTVISFKGSPAFLEATERWDNYKPPTFNVAITPGTEADVVTAVRHSRSRSSVGTETDKA